MKNILFVLTATLFLSVAQAQNVGIDDAKSAAQNFLAAAEPSHTFNHLSLYQTIKDNNGIDVMYVFNIDDYGFIIMGADRMYDPLVGYSFNGIYDSTIAAPNLKSWLNGFAQDVEAVRNSVTKNNAFISFHKECQRKWDDLLTGNTDQLASKSSKGVPTLIETKWDQGGGYNNYCPAYSQGPHGHSHTGCVATAMAQIIRYHKYPTTGFSRYSYTHQYFGRQYAAYDSVTFDYQKMPVSVNSGSPQSQQHNVSLLCYYCGVGVKMNYLNPYYTSGSGAHSQDVPDAFKFFGYANAYYMMKPTESSLWDSLLRNELDNARPVYYSGSDSEGGHAFIVDGYRDNGTYSFNFGWSGYGDGYFTISFAGGFSSTQAAVLNIIPSGLTALGDTIYIAADGEGGGSSWEDANPNLHDAIPMAKLCNKKTIWVKGGTYYGNLSSDYAFVMESKIKIYGGFKGTESSLDERDSTIKSILNGGGKRGVLYASHLVTNAAIYDMTLSGGYAKDGAGANINSSFRMERCTIENNTATEGAALLANNNIVYNCHIINNHGIGVSLTNNSSLRNSLIAHNDGDGLYLENSNISGCDIVCNNGTGIINDNADRIRNSVVWNNKTQLSSNNLSNVFFCAIEGLEQPDSNSNFGIEHENRPSSGNGPMFMNPVLTMGISDELGDWHISSRSPLVDAGDTNRSGVYKYDLDGANRFRNGRVDIGCHEYVPGNDITCVETTNISIYPNPATSTITVTGIDGTVVIYDIMGKKIKTTHTSDGSATIDVSSLPNGIYVIHAGTTSTKFVKQ